MDAEALITVSKETRVSNLFYDNEVAYQTSEDYVGMGIIFSSEYLNCAFSGTILMTPKQAIKLAKRIKKQAKRLRRKNNER